MKNLILIIAFVILFACDDKNDQKEIPEYDDTPYEVDLGDFYESDILKDVKLTEQKVKLGKMLFYEKMLSADNSQSCNSCHKQDFAFDDDRKLSLGVRGLEGKRQAMPLFNLAWHKSSFFWDGRAKTIHEQVLFPIQDELEMDESLENVINKLNKAERYQNQFIKAFGNSEINSEKIAFALEQFLITLISNNSKYDKYLRGELELSESEKRGLELFNGEYNKFFPESSGADCFHCHTGINFENGKFANNGLDTDDQMQDLGRQLVTNANADKGKFKVSSLRNIELTAPYMHDGRFATLMEVIDHYDHGLKLSNTIDLGLNVTRELGLRLSEEDKIDIINFLKTLTDSTFINNKKFMEE